MYLSKSFSRTCQPMMQTRRKASNTHRHGIPGSFPGSKVGIAIRIYMILDIRGRRPIFRITPNSSFWSLVHSYIVDEHFHGRYKVVKIYRLEAFRHAEIDDLVGDSTLTSWDWQGRNKSLTYHGHRLFRNQTLSNVHWFDSTNSVGEHCPWLFAVCDPCDVSRTPVLWVRKVLKT